ncbi:hypothetical protein EMPS_06133 [Entomortierella parvispora]|uniref:PX domain-containing protein n=1 Tax=Entomortierella parvispora TaxID=205924 RepID=A0A9P3HC27_9FUNG|nr:hypothetical protein EMPS_06133 [Entomortierella parvispora]
MGVDLRTSARDLLTLAQKASTLLQRKSDRILAEIEDADVSLTPDVEAVRSEQCQQAIDLRRSIWETSKRLKGALEHVEDIEDEDEPRILREPMEELQKLVREALSIASDPEARALLQSNKKVPKGGSLAMSASRPDPSRSLPIPAGVGSGSGPLRPGTPPITGSVHRHPLGLFSTSPKFTAQSPFSSPGRATATRLSMLTDMTANDPLSSPLASPTPTQKSPETVVKPTLTSTLTSVSDGPLSIATTIAVPSKPVAKSTQPDHSLNSAATSSSLSSAASLSTPISSPLDAPFSSPTANSTFKSRRSVEQERTASPRTETLPSPPQQRRVPRGLFSASTILQESRTMEQNPASHSETSAPWLIRNIGGYSTAVAEESIASLQSTPAHAHAPSAAVGGKEESTMVREATSTPPPPQAESSLSELRSPASPKLHRTQAKPTPIQITSPVARHTPKSRTRPDESEEEISQLARDLDKAMNPTPTEPVPQPYFLQGKGLLQRIPSQVSMDDGLLNEGEGNNQPSEESEEFEGQDNLQRGSGSLRRQRSRRFRLARSRSRNRSRTRGEARNKPALTPIDIGCSSSLASSAWPFDRPPPPLLSVNALEHQRQGRSRSRSRSRSRRPSPSSQSQRQTSAGPHLPFADSVTIGNPIRIGRGIGSFTVYTVALTLCDPTKDVTAASNARDQDWQQQQRQPESLESSQRRLVDFANGANSAHAGHVTDPLGVERSEPKPPSMASLMMTRSLSFPGLGPSAERLLMDIQPLPESQLVSTGTSAAPLGRGDSSGYSNGAPPMAKRVIQVRKRYSDFVTLRSQLVETFEDRRQSRGVNGGNYQQSRRRRLFSASTSNTPSSFGTLDQPRHHPARTQSLGSTYQEDDEDDEEGDHVDGHDSEDENNTRSLAPGATRGTLATPQNSIIRGLPKLPPKRVVGKFRPAFVEKRRRELEYFLEWVVAHPIMGDCPVVVQWFLGPSHV